MADLSRMRCMNKEAWTVRSNKPDDVLYNTHMRVGTNEVTQQRIRSSNINVPQKVKDFGVIECTASVVSVGPN